MINRIQALNLELIRLASFNNFDGDQVARDLEANTHLWRGVVMDRGNYGEICLIKLRDIEDDYWNVDTIYILVKDNLASELEDLVNEWDADKIGWVRNSGTLLGGGNGNVLRIWWD